MDTPGVWSKTSTENLIRHRSGNYYLNAKVGGKKIRCSLNTDRLKTAKIKRDEKLQALRAAVTDEPLGVRSIGDALELVAARIEAVPSHKPRTKQFYREVMATVRKSMPLKLPGGAWTKDAAARWWSGYSAERSAEQANKGLSMVKKAAEVLIEAGLRQDDPTRGLKRMRVKPSAVEKLPSRKDVERVIASIRAQKKRCSEEAANMVEFWIWSNLRKGELQKLEWEDVGKEWLTVREGKTGGRRVPISGPLRAVIERMRHEGAAGPLFRLKSPRIALAAACKREGVPHLRIHDLRHLFATQAMESGVDVPTLAKWMGHKDGGALAMRTYGHIRDDHSLEQIKKLG